MRWLSRLLSGEQTADTPAGHELIVAEARPVMSTISTKLEPEDVPEFKRSYSVRLDNRAHMELEATTWRLFGKERRWRGTLEQPNGNRIYFDPHRIADKILDPVLVPIIEAYCAEIFRMDRQFLGSGIGEFTDESGQRWKQIG